MGFSRAIRAARASGQLVRIERDAIEAGWMTGYVVAAGPSYFAFEVASSVDLRHISPDAEWEEALREIPFEAITRVDFGGDYEEALFLAAR